MSVRITDPANVALYDSVTGIAFGPVFRSDIDAAAFLDWMADEGHGYARTHTPQALAMLRDEWEQQRDGERTDKEING